MINAIYSIIPKEKLDDILPTINSFTRLPLMLIDSEGRILSSYGEKAGYCALLERSGLIGDACMTAHLKSGLRSQQLGEGYIFTCHAGLNHIAFPLLFGGELLAAIILGPFLMDKPDSTIVSAAAEKYALTPSALLDLYDELGGIPVYPPVMVNNLKKLLEYILMPLMPAERALLHDRQEKLYQQSKINETIQKYKQSTETDSSGFIELEKQLFTKARTGDAKETKKILNEILGQVFFSEGGSVDSVRTRALELMTLLSRVAIDAGAQTDSMRRLNNEYRLKMNSSGTIEDICFLLQEILESFMSAMFFRKDSGNIHIRAALQYIASNYSNRLTVGDIADKVGLSENYFSALFRRTVGVSFSEYLHRVRVEEAKNLLLSGRYSLAEIAVAVGFPDQSYFSKVFKSLTGITPGNFRS